MSIKSQNSIEFDYSSKTMQNMFGGSISGAIGTIIGHPCIYIFTTLYLLIL